MFLYGIFSNLPSLTIVVVVLAILSFIGQACMALHSSLLFMVRVNVIFLHDKVIMHTLNCIIIGYFSDLKEFRAYFSSRQKSLPSLLAKSECHMTVGTFHCSAFIAAAQFMSRLCVSILLY